LFCFNLSNCLPERNSLLLDILLIQRRIVLAHLFQESGAGALIKSAPRLSRASFERRHDAGEKWIVVGHAWLAIERGGGCDSNPRRPYGACGLFTSAAYHSNPSRLGRAASRRAGPLGFGRRGVLLGGAQSRSARRLFPLRHAIRDDPGRFHRRVA
jgi:hypothetical protein